MIISTTVGIGRRSIACTMRRMNPGEWHWTPHCESAGDPKDYGTKFTFKIHWLWICIVGNI